jgi:hypothetical protein
MTVDIAGTANAPSPPTVTDPTATQTWKLGQAVDLALAANTFTDPQGEAMTYTGDAVERRSTAVLAAFQRRHGYVHRYGSEHRYWPQH